MRVCNPRGEEATHLLPGDLVRELPYPALPLARAAEDTRSLQKPCLMDGDSASVRCTPRTALAPPGALDHQ